MANLNYDAAFNIEQTINNTTFIPNGEQGVVAPLTNAALNGFVDPTAAPNAFTTTGGPKTAAFQVNNVVAGIVVSTCTNPA